MNISPVKNEADYKQALGRVEELWGAEPGSAAGDELDILVALIEAYEREHYPIEIPDSIAAIKFRLEQEGKDYRALIGILGQRTRVYEVMRGARPLSLNMIRKLHSKLAIPAEVLIQPPQRSRPDGKRKKRSRGHSRRSLRHSA